MTNLLQRLIPILLFGCALSLCSCASKDDSTEVAEVKNVAEVKVVFEAGTQSGMTRFFRTRDLRVMKSRPAGTVGDYDFAFDAWFMGDGRVLLKPTSRNLIHVGIGDQAAFEKLVAQFDSWMVNNLDAAATAAGIPSVDGGRDYWRPAEFPCKPGHIFATRNRHPAPVPPGGRGDREVGSLLYFKSVGESGNLVLLVARAPNARSE